MEVSIDKLIGSKIPLEGYMIMYCLYNEEKDLLASYTKNVRKISTEVFLDLVKNGYLTNSSEDPAAFTIDSIELTDKFKNEVLKVPIVNNITFDQAFNQLREHYPSKVVDPVGAVRRLQSDIERCKRLYKSAILVNGEVDEATHSLILQCINFEVGERKRSKSIQYMQMLPTYLSKRSWELVQEDVEKLIIKNGSVESTTEGFNEDI